MTSSTTEWVRGHTMSLSWPRLRRTPIVAGAVDREAHQLRRDNRKRLEDIAYRTAWRQLYVRR